MPAVATSVLIALVANAVSLTFAAWVFDDFVITRGWLVAAIVLFTVLTVVLRGVVTRTVARFARGYAIVGGLVLTLLALFLTDLAVPADGGFEIHGWVAWIGVTVIVWAAGIAYGEVDHHAPPEVPPVTRPGRR